MDTPTPDMIVVIKEWLAEVPGATARATEDLIAAYEALRRAVHETPCRCRNRNADGELRKSWKLCGSCEVRSNVKKDA